MRERGSPDYWSAANTSDLRDRSRFSISPGSGGTNAVGRPAAPGVSEETSLSAGLPAGLTEPESEKSRRKFLPIKFLVDPPPGIRRLYSSWQFWAFVSSITAGGMGFIAVALLLKLPAMPNCPSIFWPTASASVRMYCAQLAANKETVKDLLEAIALVRSLPSDHPLREEVNRLTEDWSVEILNLADKSFHAGKLDEAIGTAKKIPKDLPAFKLVEEQMQRWRSVWSKAEGIYRKSEDELRSSNWVQAFRVAADLQSVDNEYWKTTKFDELNRIIQTSREDSEKLARVRGMIRRGGVENFAQAIKLVESIGQNSYLYQAAQKLVPEIGRKMLELAGAKVEQQDLEGALELARQIPANANMQAEVADFINLAQAQSVAKEGTSASIESAIATAQKITSDRPLYNRAQDLIKFWQREREDIARLEKARQLAGLGTVNDLTAAISQAQLVPGNNPRAQEARTEISRWQGQIQTMEDRPFLERAEQLAAIGDETSLQAAVYEASKIARGRALYPDAQAKMGQWVAQIQRLQDQPYLDQARDFARSGNLSEAISVAQQIQPGRSLSGEAQSLITDSQAQMRAQESWQEANRLAAQATPESLLSAIRLAQQVPKSSAYRAEAQESMNRWSYQVLTMAQDRAAYDLPGAIDMAAQIPSGTSAFADARAQIQNWQAGLNPQTNFEPEAQVQSGGQ